MDHEEFRRLLFEYGERGAYETIIKRLEAELAESERERKVVQEELFKTSAELAEYKRKYYECFTDMTGLIEAERAKVMELEAELAECRRRAADVERLVEAAIWTVKYMHHFITINESIPYDPNDEDLIGSEPFESYKKLKAAIEPFKDKT